MLWENKHENMMSKPLMLVLILAHDNLHLRVMAKSIYIWRLRNLDLELRIKVQLHLHYLLRLEFLRQNPFLLKWESWIWAKRWFLNLRIWIPRNKWVWLMYLLDLLRMTWNRWVEKRWWWRLMRWLIVL